MGPASEAGGEADAGRLACGVGVGDEAAIDCEAADAKGVRCWLVLLGRP
ncbi:hypothetical protein [Streptomyces sp. NPDC018000]